MLIWVCVCVCERDSGRIVEVYVKQKIISQLGASCVLFFGSLFTTARNQIKIKSTWNGANLLKYHRFYDCIPLYRFAWLWEHSSVKLAIINWRRRLVHDKKTTTTTRADTLNDDKNDYNNATGDALQSLARSFSSIGFSRLLRTAAKIRWKCSFWCFAFAILSFSRVQAAIWSLSCYCVCMQLKFYYAANVDVNQYPAIIHCFADTFFS